MPAELERKLWGEVNTRHPDWSQEHKQRYVFGAMRATGWRPSTQKANVQVRAHTRGRRKRVE